MHPLWLTGHGLTMKIGDFGMSRHVLEPTPAQGVQGHLERSLTAGVHAPTFGMHTRCHTTAGSSQCEGEGAEAGHMPLDDLALAL